MIVKISVHLKDELRAPVIDALRRELHIDDIDTWRDYYLELRDNPPAMDLQRLAEALVNPVVEIPSVDIPLPPGAVQVSYQSGIVDNENDSIIAVCELLGVAASAGKLATTYSSKDPDLRSAIERTRFNPAIEELHVSEPEYRSLRPAGKHHVAETFDLLKLADFELETLGQANGRNLSLRQMYQIRAIQDATGSAPVTDVLLEAMDARWSDHCSHTTWRAHGDLLGQLRAASHATGNPNIVSMFDDNAGVWDFYGDWCLAVKAETHNGPTAVAPYFGQLTKLGGVLRDILGTGLGADPIGSFEYTATGTPDSQSPVVGQPSPRQLVSETIRAVKEYGNTFGVPMMWCQMTFHQSYRAKPFALGGAVGVIPKSHSARGRPNAGDVLLLIGGLTGNDGIHGASRSSAGASMDYSAVQIGSPLEEVKFRKAVIELRDADCLSAITDLGGAGLNSAAGEMGESCGVWLNTAAVPLKIAGLPTWRILLSESQERMILAVPPDRLSDAKRICARHLVRCTAIGRFVDNDRYCVFHDPSLTEEAIVQAAPNTVPATYGEAGFDVPYSLLSYEPEPCPSCDKPATKEVRGVWPRLDVTELERALLSVVADAEIASQLVASAQYDSTVQGQTCYGPNRGQSARVATGFWAGRPVADVDGAALLTTRFNPWLYEIDPVRAIRHLYTGVLGGLVLAGSRLRDICVCDNFYTPHLDPDGATWLVAMVEELASLIRMFGVPVVSGKDSSAGSTETSEGLVHVPPAAFFTGLGKTAPASQILTEQWQTPGNILVRIGPTFRSTAGTVFQRSLGMQPDEGLDDLDVNAYLQYLTTLEATRHLFCSGAAIGPGGLASNLVRGCLADDLGVDLHSAVDAAELLFAEHRCGAIVEIEEQRLSALSDDLSPVVIGTVTEPPQLRVAGHNLLIDAVRTTWHGSFGNLFL